MVLVAGGIGITPCLSLWKHYLHSSDEKSGRKKPRKVVMVWLVREAESAERMYADQFEGVVDEKREIVLHGDQRGSSSSLMKEDTIFQYHFFVTKGEVQSEVESQHQRWNHGRVNMRELFRAIGDYAISAPHENGKPSRVGVMVCGPFPLIKDVQSSVSEERGRVQIDVHEEFFSL